MTIRAMALSAATAAALTSVAYAGPCSPQIDGMQARVDAKLAAEAAHGPSATEGNAALTHRQPTPGSIAAAEEKLGDLSANRAAALMQGMTRAREADSAGDNSACERALADVERALAQ
jgi:hypothetical protein